MIKKYIINVVVGSLLAYVIAPFLLDGGNNLENASFAIGVAMTSFGLLTVTDATSIFRGMGYVLKKLFTKRVQDMSYYDYLLSKQKKKEPYSGYPLLFAGITLIILSLTLAPNL
ncbi:MAG: DUF3899 domain-containing protein [Bacillota bacterium]